MFGYWFVSSVANTRFSGFHSNSMWVRIVDKFSFAKLKAEKPNEHFLCLFLRSIFLDCLKITPLVCYHRLIANNYYIIKGVSTLGCKVLYQGSKNHAEVTNLRRIQKRYSIQQTCRICAASKSTENFTQGMFFLACHVLWNFFLLPRICCEMVCVDTSDDN